VYGLRPNLIGKRVLVVIVSDYTFANSITSSKFNFDLKFDFISKIYFYPIWNKALGYDLVCYDLLQ
jgi:hypothetical protein